MAALEQHIWPWPSVRYNNLQHTFYTRYITRIYNTRDGPSVRRRRPWVHARTFVRVHVAVRIKRRLLSINQFNFQTRSLVKYLHVLKRISVRRTLTRNRVI